MIKIQALENRVFLVRHFYFKLNTYFDIWQDLIIKGPKKRSLHHFRWRRVLLLVLLLLFRLQAKRIIFCKSDKKPDFFAMLKRWGKTILSDLHFLQEFLSHLKQCKISKEPFLGSLYYEILPYNKINMCCENYKQHFKMNDFIK